MNRKLLVFLAAIAAAAALATGIAVGSVNPPSAGVTAAFSAFGTSESSSAKDAMIAAVSQGFASEPDSPAAQADLDLARSVTLGTGETAWIAPSGDSVCVFIPDPVTGYGASCPTLDQINGGHGVVVLGPAAGSSGPFLVAVPTPDGASGPQIIHADRSQTTVTPSNNLALTEASATDTVQTSSATISLGDLNPGG